jgi:hypothetical protein
VFASRNPAASPAPRGRRRVSFWSHELVEYAVGLALIAVGLQLSRGLLKEYVVLGACLIVLNLFTKGRLGVVKYFGRHLHHVGDYLLIGFAAASPFFGFVRHDLGAIFAVEAVALLLAFVEQSTRYRDPPASQRKIRVARVVPSPSEGPKTPGKGSFGPASRFVARRAGVVAGVTKRVIRNRRNAS